MNIEAYDIETLRKIVRSLQEDNKNLKKQLSQLHIAYEERDVFSELNQNNAEYDYDQGGRIIHPDIITKYLANVFFYMFWGRRDVYAKRGKNGGYFPQCENFWNNLCPKQRGKKVYCENCNAKKWKELTLETIVDHLNGKKEDGSDVIGIYPLFPDGTCRFLVFDFDNHEKGSSIDDFADQGNEWKEEVDALRKICTANGIQSLVERSRSGKGAHIWIFFKSPIDASLARNFGLLLLEKGSSEINIKSFHYYDRMFPSQDTSSYLGNLVALPLQGQALKNGNSAFVDENWNAYPNQWDTLFKIKKLDVIDIENNMRKWQCELENSNQLVPHSLSEKRPKPWNKKIHFSKFDVIGKLHIVMSDGLYIDSINIFPRLQNQIRSIAAFDNPEYYKNAKYGYSNYYNFSSIYLGKDIEGYIQIPRGLKEKLLELCKQSEITFDIADQRIIGRPIRAIFKGDLRVKQNIAVKTLLEYEDGILQAATAFGKTVVCSYLISERKVSTLILLQNKSLIDQWVEKISEFLEIDEQPPEYFTKTGIKKRRKSVIGVLHGSKNTLTGIIDVAMVQSLSGKKNIEEILDSYGMVIIDECHHAASTTYVNLLEKVKSKYVYGVSANVKRGDKLEKIIPMLIGPLRHSYSALESSHDQEFNHFFIPRYTRIVDNFETKENINKAFTLIANSEVRNTMIIEDVKECVNTNKTPIILTKMKEHAKYLGEKLNGIANHIFVLYGDNSDKENNAIVMKLKSIPRNETVILVATGQKVGEGFDFPRLDVLFLASPVSFEGRLEQYVGRLNRNYEGKKDVFVYDYVDSHMKFFNRMYEKRLRTYKKIGFTLWENEKVGKQKINSIFDSGNYTEKFERDLIEAEKEIVISSPGIQLHKINRFMDIVKIRQEKGVKVTVITTEPDNVMFGNYLVCTEMINNMKELGIHVITKNEVEEHFAVIDNRIVWHGGMNLLGKEDIWDNLMRIENPEVAAELLEIELK